MTTPNTAADSTAPTLSDDQLDAFFDRVGRLIEQCGANKNDRGIAAIGACILEGIDTHRHILGILKRLGFITSHASVLLAGGTKKMRHDVPWLLNKATGRYILKN